MRTWAVIIGGGLLGASAIAMHGCADTPNVVATEDGGRTNNDAGSSPKDAARVDGPEDAAVPTDGGFVLRGEWLPIPGVPSTQCKYAVEPAKSIDPLEWEPCVGRPGCQRLKVTWTPYYRSLQVDQSGAVVDIGGTPHILLRRDYPSVQGGIPERMIHTAEDFSGHVKFALASRLGKVDAPDLCTGLSASFGLGGLVGIYASISSELQTPDQAARVVWAPLANPSAIAAKGVGIGELGTPPLHAQVGDGRIFILPGNYSPRVLDTATKAVLPANGNHPMLSMQPVPGGVVGVDWTPAAGVGFLSNDGAFTNLYRPSGAFQVTAVRVDRTDGNRIVWAEATDVSPQVNTVYWTAPFTTNPAAFQPRRITAFETNTGNGMSFAAVNAGLIVNFDYDAVLLTRISDGWSWRIPSLPKEFFFQGMWVDDNDIWLATGISTHPTGDPQSGLEANGILRFSRTSLGPPTIPPT